ncbi:hypothetical protein K505DRAFT_334652 [Melanomma pulvis-pyrius CBS 109.77]|uniref:Uncharacterized protein n=1 Tax=Melanomma pulvis-pyrius CBS 109.77 TaxID=1314802 RepID=A0A6A6XLN6_9PLEO|nr:hypothetical protein K505DRAFT_334652 [Melanomma pulvis-pyrius CBS 109.77]
MPPKREDILSRKLEKKGKSKVPQSEIDFLQAADDFEKSAGKWRAGDIEKATRFFQRAIDMLDAGLQRYPKSFDLAYNKATLEYTLLTNRRILALLGDKNTLLEASLASHRTAISLNPSNTDILFNTGQVLTSISEVLLENSNQETAKPQARACLEEALDIFTKCLDNQQSEYEQMQAEIAKANASQEHQEFQDVDQEMSTEALEQDSMEVSSNSSESPGEWATVVEPVTPEAILDTCIAKLSTLTSLLILYDGTNQQTMELKIHDGISIANDKMLPLITLIGASLFSGPTEEPAPGPTLSIASPSTIEDPGTSLTTDALLTIANFRSAVAEFNYRNHHFDASKYAAEVEQIFANLIKTPPNPTQFDPDFTAAMSAYADALTDLASAIADLEAYTPSSPTFLSDLEVQWSALSRTQTVLSQISIKSDSGIRSSSRLAGIYAARGDTDLFRFRISLFAEAKPAWADSKLVLVANAGVYYRGAGKHAVMAGEDDVQKTVDAKATVAEILKEAASGEVVSQDKWKGNREELVRVLEDMVEEGIVERENAEGVLRHTRLN